MNSWKLAVSCSLFLAASNPVWANSETDLFAKTCATCHGEKGVGTQGLAPPLQNAELWSRLGDKAPHYIAGVMVGGMSGKITANGEDYIGLVMPPMSSVPSEDLALIAGYVLQTLNGVMSAPDKALVDGMKTKPLSHKELRNMRKGQ
ncbi:cytochrome c [Rhizobium sp. ARZ01]|uniref:c-type cytochrome n=1 Tax=Rhizobium sp. ARZ01 TaxID=2769313 RepID=UPI00177F8D96|nr:cytochrome c [Rhizobium sp. ARZ01]MBD9375433.1 cytochrome c [Rhizobium sp. ARZ01]